MTGAAFLDISVNVAFWMVMASVVFAVIRLARGPSLPDRVVALDMLTVIVVAFCGLFGIFTGVSAFLDVALIVALVGFLGTVALARFAERRTVRRRAADRPSAADGRGTNPEAG